MASGVYTIKNSVNGKQYIGSSTNMTRRWKNHVSKLRLGTHSNHHLQSAFDKYGSDAFLFVPLMICDPKDVLIYEQFFLNILNPEYNNRIKAESNLGLKLSNETRAKMSAAHKRGARTCTDETKRKISAANKGRKPSAQAIKNSVLARKGKPVSDEWKHKQREAKIGIPLSNEHKEKMKHAHRPMSNPDEWKKKQSLAHKGKPWTEKRRNACKKHFSLCEVNYEVAK